MATIAEIKKARQELNTKAHLLYQAEVFSSFQWISGYLQSLKAGNDTTDFKLALIKDAITIWDTGIYSNENLKKIFQDTSKIGGGWEGLLKEWVDIKKNAKLIDSSYTSYFSSRRALPYIYDDFNNEITQLEQAKAAAEASLKEYKEKLGSETPEQLNKRPDTAQEVLNNAGKNEITILTQDFKNECERILKDWNTLIAGYNYTHSEWSVVIKRIKEWKDKILNDPFLNSFSTRTPEEQLYFLKRIEYRYNWNTWIDETNASFSEVASDLRTTNKTDVGLANIAVIFYDFKNNFLKQMIDLDKWDNTAKLAELARYKEQAGGKTPDELKAELDSLKKRPDITPEDFQKLKDNQFKHPDDHEDSKISDQKKGPFLTYLHTRPVFSKLYKEIKKLDSIFNVDLLHVTDDKSEFLKNLSEHRFNFLLWELKNGSWSVLWTEYRDKFDYYTDTDVELEFLHEEAQIKKYLKGESGKSFEHLFSHWGIDNSEEGKNKQGFATVAIETILKRIKDNPKLAMAEKLKINDLNLLEGSANIAQKEYDVYLEQLNQKDQKIEQISQIEVGPLNK